ncbi:GrpB family protein [Kitasatospora viridis]|uniref:GrpB family protein n=1 Tax=Kitasatospora viridis TaxID=281105 RepID=UPI001BA9BA1A|nr:GrpB family protein [Kitasatospora viridis]
MIVQEYDPSWPGQFEQLRARVLDALGDLAVGVEHVGSTAVPGLPAKPVIDLDVVVASAEDVPAAVERLAGLGYQHEGDLGIPGREAFRWPSGSERHHLYLCPRDSPELARHLRFRDHLRAHPEVAAAYARLKLDAAAAHRDDRDAYSAAKSGFVEQVLRAASAS